MTLFAAAHLSARHHGAIRAAARGVELPVVWVIGNATCALALMAKRVGVDIGETYPAIVRVESGLANVDGLFSRHSNLARVLNATDDARTIRVFTSVAPYLHDVAAMTLERHTIHD